MGRFYTLDCQMHSLWQDLHLGQLLCRVAKVHTLGNLGLGQKFVYQADANVIAPASLPIRAIVEAQSIINLLQQEGTHIESSCLLTASTSSVSVSSWRTMEPYVSVKISAFCILVYVSGPEHQYVYHTSCDALTGRTYQRLHDRLSRAVGPAGGLSLPRHA